MSRPVGVLAARSISKSYGDSVVLDRISLTVSSGSRIGIVGPNGIGKSTLLRLLAGVSSATSGVVSREPADLTVSYLEQERSTPGMSGGQAARAFLEQVIASDAAMLLLDEPTNDLDFAGLELLERFVDRHRGGLVAVSHDRAFLERMTQIVEFEAETRRIRVYAGGWSAFSAERACARTADEKAFARSAAEQGRIEQQARRMRTWEERGYGQGRKKKKSKDVRGQFERKLARVESVEKPWAPWRLELDLTPSRQAGDVVVRLEQAVVARDGFSLGPIDLELGNGDRLAVVGRNGAGKTTLLKALLGELPLVTGRRWVGPGVRLGELPQGSHSFADATNLLDAFVAASGATAGAARGALAKFQLGADDVLRSTDSLSPGERSRAGLALLAVRGVNALVLDEPTNHLDLEAIEQLESALDAYRGTVVLVTHDRRFLETFDPTHTFAL